MSKKNNIYKMNENNNDVKIVAFDIPKSSTKRSLKNKPKNPMKPEEKLVSETEITNGNKTGIKKFSKLFLIIGIIALVVIIVSVLLALLLSKKNKKNKTIINHENNEPTKSPETPILPEKKDDQVLKPIYIFNNTVGDLKRINVQQITHKNDTINGQKTHFLVYRDTTYDIFIMSEESPDENNTNFYTNKYSAVINVVKECYSQENENCEPKDYIDFSKNEDNDNLRNLEEDDDLKDVPLPLCIFNFTDNNVITSASCPESLPKTKINEMMLDFYFFRPPAIEKPQKENPLKYVRIDTYPTSYGKFNREFNSGICDVIKPLNSYCTTDMNTTTDFNNNVMTYDEYAYSCINVDSENSYVKKKVTHLKDITNLTEYLNKETHKNQLDYFLGKLGPYLNYDVTFSTQNFEELYSIVKQNSTSNKKLNKRNLELYFSGIDPYIKDENLFLEKIDGVQITLNLRNDIGIDKMFMSASSILSLNNEGIMLATKSEQTHLNKLLQELIILSKAGNNLANELYDQIKQKLNDITKNITLTISSLNDLIEYDDLVSIFDSALSIDKLTILPKGIVSESNNLFNSLNNKLHDTEEITNYKKTLNKDIYDFLDESFVLVQEILEKIKDLGKKLGSNNGQLTEIATYYLNHTSISYTTIVSKAENILRNYYKNEKELISDEMDLLLKSFEQNIKKSIEKELGIIKNIKSKVEYGKMTIDSGNNNDAKNLVLNLDNSIILVSDIITQFKDKIKSSLDIKTSGYFINEDKIKSFQKKVDDGVKEANENAQKFDNEELIDKIYDEIMKNFRQNFTEIKNYMSNKRDENFIMDEGVLKNNKFTINETEKLSDYLKTMRSSIVNEIINENNNYNTEITNKVNNLVSLKKEPLNQLIKNVDALLSESKLKKLSNLYKNTFENSFELVKKQINNNKQLSYQYLDYLIQVLSNNTEIVIHIDPYSKYKIGQAVWSFTTIQNIDNIVAGKKITESYRAKYEKYSSCFDSLKEYLNSQMNIDLVYQYKNLIIKIKELLQSVKDNKFSDKYGDLTELAFINDNYRIIDNLYTRFDKYFSESLYDNDYLEKYYTFKKNEIQEIEKIKQALIEKNKLLTDNYESSNDKTNDFCAAYTQAVTHTCKNGNIYNFVEGDSVCVHLRYYSDNHNKLVSLSIKSENNLEELETEFNKFYSSLNQNINEYNNAFTALKNEITSLENDAMDIKKQLNGLNDINVYFNTFLNQKYGNILVKDSYDFYKNNLENKLKILLDNINEKWIESFKITESQIKLNKNKFKNKVDKFYMLAYIYIDLVSKDIIYDYTDPIINQQINEFNYTISYYYNYLYNSVNKTYQYIIGKIPINKNGFNNIVNYRKNQVIEKYNEILQIIKNSENNALSEKNQINLLIVPITDFFYVNNKTQEKIVYLVEKLYSIADNMIDDADNIGGTDTAYSIAARLYLENSENGKIVEELSDSINRVSFVNLNLEKFKELIDNYIILDQEDLISSANTIIFESTLEISTEYQRIRETYYNQLENEITNYFTKESLVENIDLIYENGINNLDKNSRNTILLNVNEILDVITNHIKSESERLSTTITYNSNYETINKTIKYYKEETFNKVKNEMTNLFETLKNNIYNRIYTNHVEKGLNQYLTEIKNVTSNKTRFTEYKSLGGSSYKIRDDIDEIAEVLSSQYKFAAKEEIENSSLKSDYYEALNLEEIEKLINEKIESSYTSYLFPALKKYAVYDVKDSSYFSYDLSNDIKNNINSKINENIDKIKSIMSNTKGENYEFELDYHKTWKILDFSNIRKLILKINENFDKYFTYVLDNEKTSFNNSISNSIKFNFNRMLDNFITSFGDKFFERVGEFNLINKISYLLKNYEYSFIQTYFYIVFVLTENIEFDQQRDLIDKIIKLNDIDLNIEQNKNMIIEIFSSKIDDFIKETSDFLIDKYSSYMQKDEHNIEFTNMSEELKNLIITNIIDSKNVMENDYKNTLQNHLKNPLIQKYKKALEEMSNDLIKAIQEFRQELYNQIENITITNSEEDLIEINEKINLTLKQIDNYNNHLKQYKMSENIKKILSSYGDNSINPIFKSIIKLINDATKNYMFEDLNKNSDNYEKKLDINPFYKKANESYSYLNQSFIYPISKQISIYDAQNYPNKLENEKEKINKRKRRLVNSNTEDDIKQDYNDRVADKPLDDTFSKLLETADSVQDYVDSLNEFNKYDKLISNYVNDLKIAVKNSSRIIKDYEFDENTTNILNDKLSHLQNLSLSYYNNVNNSFSIVRNYIKTSIEKINFGLKKCANATYETFANNYKEILNNEYSNTINTKYSDTVGEVETIEYNSTMQNGITIFKIDISNLERYSEFKFEVKYEEIKNIKKPILIASIINKNKPKQMKIKSYEPVGYNGKNGYIRDVNFNDVNYSTIINFDTKSTNINVTTLGRFDEYSYTVVPFKEEEKENCMKCITMNHRTICWNLLNCGEEFEITEKKQKINIDSKEIFDIDILGY